LAGVKAALEGLGGLGVKPLALDPKTPDAVPSLQAIPTILIV